MIRLVSSVTAPWLGAFVPSAASALPLRVAAVTIVIEALARMVPTNAVDPPMAADLPEDVTGLRTIGQEYPCGVARDDRAPDLEDVDAPAVEGQRQSCRNRHRRVAVKAGAQGAAAELHTRGAAARFVHSLRVRGLRIIPGLQGSAIVDVLMPGGPGREAGYRS